MRTRFAMLLFAVLALPSYGAGASTPQGLKHPSIAPYGGYTTGDGKENVISIQNEREWQQFCAVFLEQPQIAGDVRFVSNTERVRNRASLDATIGEVFAQLDTDEALACLAATNTAYGQVRSVAETTVHPALRTGLMQLGDREIEKIAPPASAVWDEQRFAPAPLIGQHSAMLRDEFAASARSAEFTR